MTDALHRAHVRFEIAGIKALALSVQRYRNLRWLRGVEWDGNLRLAAVGSAEIGSDAIPSQPSATEPDFHFHTRC